MHHSSVPFDRKVWFQAEEEKRRRGPSLVRKRGRDRPVAIHNAAGMTRREQLDVAGCSCRRLRHQSYFATLISPEGSPFPCPLPTTKPSSAGPNRLLLILPVLLHHHHLLLLLLLLLFRFLFLLLLHLHCPLRWRFSRFLVLDAGRLIEVGREWWLVDGI